MDIATVPPWQSRENWPRTCLRSIASIERLTRLGGRQKSQPPDSTVGTEIRRTGVRPARPRCERTERGNEYFPRLHLIVFRGWQVNPNSIFGDGILSAPKKHSEYLRPQMDVWFRSTKREPCREAQAHGGGADNIPPGSASRTSGRKTSVFPLDKTYHGCPFGTAA